MYNLVDFALFQNRTLNKTLSSEYSIEKKYKKARIIINLTCNVIKSHKFDTLFIRKIAIPCCFSQLCINIKNFQIDQ